MTFTRSSHRWGFSATAVTIAALTFLLASPSMAQEPGGRGAGGKRGGGAGGFGGMGGFGGIDKSVLLGSDQVRKELKISDDQGKKLDEALTAHRQALRDTFSASRGAQGASEEERAKAREENAKKTAELSKKADAKFAEVLDKTQTERLDQIVLQQRGGEALTSEGVIASLKLSKEQVDKVKAAVATRDEELGKLRGSFRRPGGDGGAGGAGGGNFQEIREKTEKIRKDFDTAAMAVLTREQSESFTKMKGPAFELDRASLMRGGFGRGGDGQGRGGAGAGGGQEKQRPPSEDGKSDSSKSKESK